MRRLRLLVLACVLVAPALVTVFGQEIVTLTTPIAKASTTTCSVDTLLLDLTGTKRIVTTLTCNNGDIVTKQYDAFSTPTGASLLTTLNSSNNSAGNSLIKKIYARLALDGIAVGTVSGTPQ